MATYIEQSDLIVGTVSDLIDLRDDAYARARADLSALAGSLKDLPYSWVDTDIGEKAEVDWSGSDVALPSAPVEPDWSGQTPQAVPIPAPSVPAAVGVQAAPTWTDALETPDALGDSALGPLAVLGALPAVTAATPSLDVGLLSTEFSFSEPEITERVSAEVEAGIKRVLGGDMGLPASYWDALWRQASGDLARQQLGRLRSARNRGAASHWGLPGETVLSASREIQDEGARALQVTRMQQALQAATFAREDFWQAINQGLAYEAQWIGANQQVAARALAAAEQLHTLRVQVHNANLGRFQQAMERARLAGTLDDLHINRDLRRHAAVLQGNAQELGRAAHEVERFQARYQGYQIASGARVQDLGERVRYWMGQADTHQKYEALKQAKTKLDLDNYTAQMGRVATLADATSRLLGARTVASDLGLRGQVSRFDAAARRNATGIDVARLTQAAQGEQARLDIAQGQYITGQSQSQQARIAELTVGIAQAAIAAADVALGSSVGISLSGRA